MQTTGFMKTRKKSFQSKLPTEVTVCYKPYCVYIFAKKREKKAFEARLRDGRPKFRNAAKKAKQNKATEERLRGATFVRSSAKKANPLPEKKREKKPKSYSGRLLTASVGRQ